MSGAIVDEYGRPVRDALVILSSGLERRTASDADGHFRFEGVTPGTYRLDVRTIGYNRANHRVVVPAGGARVRVTVPRMIYDGPCIVEVLPSRPRLPSPPPVQAGISARLPAVDEKKRLPPSEHDLGKVIRCPPPPAPLGADSVEVRPAAAPSLSVRHTGIVAIALSASPGALSALEGAVIRVNADTVIRDARGLGAARTDSDGKFSVVWTPGGPVLVDGRAIGYRGLRHVHLPRAGFMDTLVYHFRRDIRVECGIK
ncbi:MAG: carboxypeptidase regulatory-like domain-containing protein [Gemmatimonadaceae bacterium]|nr:carboxypeptidase regulatory-like domain-containing protein [Gemmatimonadaceae bacterium]